MKNNSTNSVSAWFWWVMFITYVPLASYGFMNVFPKWSLITCWVIQIIAIVWLLITHRGDMKNKWVIWMLAAVSVGIGVGIFTTSGLPD